MKAMGRYQQGMTMWQMGSLFVGVGFAVMCAMSLIPHYIDDANVSSMLANMHGDFSSRKGSQITNTEIQDKMYKYAAVNAMNKAAPESLEIDRTDGNIILTMNYEVREPLIGNIDVVLTFKHTEDFSKPVGGN